MAAIGVLLVGDEGGAIVRQWESGLGGTCCAAGEDALTVAVAGGMVGYGTMALLALLLTFRWGPPGSAQRQLLAAFERAGVALHRS